MPSIEATTITIAQIKESDGKGPGWIRDTAGVFWKLWPDKYPQFAGMEGQQATINFKTEEYRGKLQYTIIGLAGAATGMPAAPPRVAAPKVTPITAVAVPQFPAPKPDYSPAKRSEDIAILALVKLYEKQLQVGDRQALVSALRMCRSAWRELQTGNVSLQEELNDELPSFEEPGKGLDETF